MPYQIETVESDKCSCYFNHECVKKTIVFRCEYTNETYYFQLCKSYISDKLKQREIFSSYAYDFRWHLEDVILKELYKYKEIFSPSDGMIPYKLSDIGVDFVFSQRPFIYRKLNFLQCVEAHKKRPYDNAILIELFKSISLYLSNKRSDKNTIPNLSSIKRIMTKIKKAVWSDSNQIEPLFNELLIEVTSKKIKNHNK
jgi:hypothetical protein